MEVGAETSTSPVLAPVLSLPRVDSAQVPNSLVSSDFGVDFLPQIRCPLSQSQC